jgi:hypothetical protein
MRVRASNGLTIDVFQTLALFAWFADDLDSFTSKRPDVFVIGELDIDQDLDSFSLFVGIVDMEVFGDAFADGRRGRVEESALISGG